MEACRQGLLCCAVAVYCVLSIVTLCLPLASYSLEKSQTLSAQILIDYSNAERVSRSVPHLSTNEDLAAAASAKAHDMAERGYFSHNTPEGESPWKWVREEGYSFTRVGENIAVGYANEYKVIEGWLNSPGHRENLLNEKFTDIGIGIALGTYKGREATYVVQFFGSSTRVPEEIRTSLAKSPITTELSAPKRERAQTAAVAEAVVGTSEVAEDSVLDEETVVSQYSEKTFLEKTVEQLRDFFRLFQLVSNWL